MGPGEQNVVWDTLKKDPVFWENLPSLIYGEIWRKISILVEQSRHAVYFVTNRVSDVVPPEIQTSNFLRKHGVLAPSVIVSSKKGEIAKAIGATHAIDDKLENAWAVHWISDSPQTKSYLLDRPYNRIQSFPDIGPKRVKRVVSVEEFLKKIENG